MSCSTMRRLLTQPQGRSADTWLSEESWYPPLSRWRHRLTIFNSEPTSLVRFPRILAALSQPNFVVGHFYFTTLLIPALLAGAKSSPDGKARVVNTSSFASLLTSGVNFNTLKDTPARKKLTSSSLYAQSKLVGVFAYSQTAPFTTKFTRETCYFPMN